VLGEAAQCAADLDAALTIVHAVTPDGGMSALLMDADARERAIRLATMQIDVLRRRLAPAAGLRVRMGSTGAVINRVIRDEEAGLLVCGGDRESILAAESACPVLRVAVPRASVLRAPEPEFSAKCA
jgi:nucleotide-binding universal stress UspA family protein